MEYKELARMVKTAIENYPGVLLEITVGIPFVDYHELLADLNNSIGFISSVNPYVGFIRGVTLPDGTLIHLVESVDKFAIAGKPHPDHKFFGLLEAKKPAKVIQMYPLLPAA